MHAINSNLRRVRNFVISLVYWVFCCSGQAVRRLWGVQDPGRCVVLCYHSVLPEERAAFGKQVDKLKRMATLVMADKTDSLAPGSRYAAITFDDAFTHVVLSILPELVARGIPSTLFVPSGPIGGSATWHQTAHSRDREETIATADQLRALPPELVLIGSHSVSHKNMCLLSQQEADWELRESRATLERILGRPVTTFAFPYARFNTRLVEQCKAVGYLRVFTGQPRREPMTQDNYVVGRVRVDPTDTLAEFRLKVYGAYGWLPAMSGVKQRLLRLVGAASAKGRHHADLTSQENRFS